jgi:hypothetical protein
MAVVEGRDVVEDLGGEFAAVGPLLGLQPRSSSRRRSSMNRCRSSFARSQLPSLNSV